MQSFLCCFLKHFVIQKNTESRQKPTITYKYSTFVQYYELPFLIPICVRNIPSDIEKKYRIYSVDNRQERQAQVGISDYILLNNIPCTACYKANLVGRRDTQKMFMGQESFIQVLLSFVGGNQFRISNVSQKLFLQSSQQCYFWNLLYFMQKLGCKPHFHRGCIPHVCFRKVLIGYTKKCYFSTRYYQSMFQQLLKP